MSDGGWIVIPNWRKFQHYTDRKPTWIKLYLDLRDRDEWEQLTFTERGLLVSIWLEWCAHDGVLSALKVRSMVHRNVRQRALHSLQEAGFIAFSASKPLALSRALAKREEKDLPKKVSKKKPGPSVTGWRFVRGSHGATYVKDPAGTDKPPAGYA